MRRLGSVIIGLLLAVALVATTATPASAESELDIVHTETVSLGDTTLTASFTDWPLRADRSLDFTFEPEGGIEGRSGTLRTISPDGEPVEVGWLDDSIEVDLPRHPLVHDVWGLDIVALPQEGTWTFEFTIADGEDVAKGSLPIKVGPRPGPPKLLGWTVGLLPWLALVPFLVYGWVRTRPTRRQRTLDWTR
ncbi:MAG: hypothetical protein ACRD0P_05115 [Stackebrandtia sp.]